MSDYSPVPPPAPAYQNSYAVQAKTNVLAIISLIAAFVMPVAAIVTGHIAMSQIRRTGEQGEGLAKAGLILGYVFTSLGVLFFIAYILFFVVLIATQGSGY
jgi:large-conductance mechanosensitive channel